MAVNTILIPQEELTPGAVGAIRNQVIESVVAKAASELRMSPDQLVVRDVRPATDLAMYSGGTTTSTVDIWEFTATGATAGYSNVSTAAQMGDQRWVAFFGVRDLRKVRGIHATTIAILDVTGLGEAARAPYSQAVSLIRFNVGGGDRAIWDITGIQAYAAPVGFTPAAVIIPQNTSYQIAYSTTKAGQFNAGIFLQLIGVVVEPRGRTISP